MTDAHPRTNSTLWSHSHGPAAPTRDLRGSVLTASCRTAGRQPGAAEQISGRWNHRGSRRPRGPSVPSVEGAESVAASVSREKGPGPDGFAGGSAARGEGDTSTARPMGGTWRRGVHSHGDPTGRCLPDADSKQRVSELSLIARGTWDVGRGRAQSGSAQGEFDTQTAPGLVPTFKQTDTSSLTVRKSSR